VTPDPLLLDQLAQAGPLGRLAVNIAHAEMTAGVAEIPPGSNRGPRVDQYLTGYDSRPYLLCGLRAADKPCPLCAGKPGPTPACKSSP
jgi:hypothetical protein